MYYFVVAAFMLVLPVASVGVDLAVSGAPWSLALLAMGTLGVASLFMPGWQLGAALVGALFYGLAGANHLRQAHRNRMENIAMASDLFVAMVLLVVCVGAIARH